MLLNLNDKKVTKIAHQNVLTKGKNRLGDKVTAEVEAYIDNQIPLNTVHTAGWMQNEKIWISNPAFVAMNAIFEQVYPDNPEVVRSETGKLFGLFVFERFMLDVHDWYFEKTEDFGIRYFMKTR